MRVGAAIFGISEYVDDTLNSDTNRLRYASNDAISFERYVRAAWSAAPHTAIECWTDRTATLAQWSSSVARIADFKPDFFVVYLAGHAFRTDESKSGFYLTDTRGSDSVLNAEEIDRAFNSVGADTSILLLDCCHAEAVVGQAHFFRTLGGSHARLFLCSARSDQRAWEDASIRHGLFSNAVIRGLAHISPLADADGYVDIDDLFAFVSSEVSKRAFARKDRARQEPVRGGLSTTRLRLPTAAVTALGTQISTYDAVATSFRRWLTRTLVLLTAFFIISDLSFQHLTIDADGNIVVHSGLPLLDPVRRILPGGIIDTGFDRQELDPHNSASSEAIDALRNKRLVANRLWASNAWPAKLSPALATGARQTLSVLLYGRVDENAEKYDTPRHAPPTDVFVGLLALNPAIDRLNAAHTFAYDLPQVDLDCAEDVENHFNFAHLNPSTERFIEELDWRLVTASTLKERQTRFNAVSRIVAYRHRAYTRQRARGIEQPKHDSTQEFARLADWAYTLQDRLTPFPIRPPESWCSLTESFLSALSNDPDAANAGEHALLKFVETYNGNIHGDALTSDAEIALALLSIVARHRFLEEKIVDNVSGFLRSDKRGLNGTPAFVEWLEAIAPTTPLPKITHDFLFEILLSTRREYDFEQLKAFNILSKNAKHLDSRERAIVVKWAQENHDEYTIHDSYAEAISYLASYLPINFVRDYILSLVARTNPSRAISPPERSWRGDLVIASSDIPEWTAISRIAQNAALAPHVSNQILTFAAISDSVDARRHALLALANQLEDIRANDWDGFRRRLIRLASDGNARDVLSEAAGLQICGQTYVEDEAKVLLSMWSRERVPILRIGLAKAIQYAALCALTK